MKRRIDGIVAKRGGGDTRLIATLWQLAWNDDRLSCTIYRNRAGLQLRLESTTAVIMSEPFELQPRALARTRTLRTSLKRRGWQDCPTG